MEQGTEQGACAGCGRPLPRVGRFCTNCGLLVGATPPAPDPAPEPEPEPAAPESLARSAPDEPEDDHPGPAGPVGAGARGLLPVAAVILALLLVAGIGTWLMLGAGGDGGSPLDTDESSKPTKPLVTTPIPTSPSEDETDAVRTRTKPTQQRDDAEVAVPATAADGTGVDGSTVSFVGDNLLDGDPGTAWRMDGDGSDSTLTFTFPTSVALTKIGLINGYAKTEDGFDWYHGNRRVSSVQWVLDDGTTLDQRLGDSQRMQTIAVDRQPTTTLQLRLGDVSEPGTGAASRDYTAISDVTLVGVPEP